MVVSDGVFMYPILVVPDLIKFVRDKLYNMSVIRAYVGYKEDKCVFIAFDI